MAEEYEVLFDWEPENADDLRLFAGETLEVLQKNEHGWWYGLADRSGTLHKGYFPKNYVKPVVILPDAPKPPPRPSRPTELPTPDPAPSQLMETVSKLSLEPRGPSFSLKTCQAFDDLMELGYAVEIEDPSSSTTAGDSVAKGFHVELNCVAKIWDGASTVTKEFANGTVAFVVGKNQVVSGLDAAVQQLKVGQKATITCSPAKAYGGAGNPPSVPPNSFIVFSVEVLSTGLATGAAASSSSTGGTQMLLDSGVANNRKVKGSTENRRDSRIILVSGESGTSTPTSTTGNAATATTAATAAPTATTGTTGTTTAGNGAAGPTPPKPIKPSHIVAPPPSASHDPGSPDSLALNNNIHDA